MKLVPVKIIKLTKIIENDVKLCIVCQGDLLACALYFAVMCIPWSGSWLHVLWWPVCVDYLTALPLIYDTSITCPKFWRRGCAKNAI
jgi:hypothetical protein